MNETKRQENLKERLKALQEGSLDFEEIISTLAQFEDAHFIEAASIVEQLALGHEDPIVRTSALSTLLFYMSKPEYIQLALEILQKDPDDDPRSTAAAGLGYFAEAFGATAIVPILIAKAKNDAEATLVRKSAYDALLEIKGKPRLSPTKRWIPEEDIDWKFIEALEKEDWHAPIASLSQLDNQVCDCYMWTYLLDKQLMRMEVSIRESGMLCLTFKNVEYFEGPIVWRDVRLRLGTDDERTALVQRLRDRQIKSVSSEHFDWLSYSFRLIIAEGSSFIGQILAAQVNAHPGGCSRYLSRQD